MNSISDFLYVKIKWHHALILTIAMVAYASLVMGSQSEAILDINGQKVRLLGLRFGYGHAIVLKLLEMLPITALRAYRELLLLWDNLFPLIYASMYISWLTLIYKNQKFRFPSWKSINLFPIIPMFADFLENIFEYRVVDLYFQMQEVSISMVNTASLFSQLKWICSFTNYLLILIGILLLIRQHSK